MPNHWVRCLVPGVNAMFASYVPATVSCAAVSAIDASAALAMPGVIGTYLELLYAKQGVFRLKLF